MRAEAGLEIWPGRPGPSRIAAAGRGNDPADRGPEAPAKLSEIDRLGSGVGEGNRTPGLQNHNLAL